MGLPLFVAPVESDVARKPSHKNSTTSPSRTSIRRVDRAHSRERQRNVARRAAARIYGPVQRTLSGRNLERPLPWIELPASGALTRGASQSRPIPDRLDPPGPVNGEDARRSQRMSQRMEEHMASVLGTNWHDLPPGPPTEEENQETDLGWWSIDPRGRARRPRMMTPISSRFTRSPDTLEAARARTSSPLAAENASRAEQSARQQRFRMSVIQRERLLRARSQSTEHGTGIDGLGDRERSISPEEWDNLFTTLAPDPQPPSANTSFASATGTQSAGQTAAAPSTGGSILPDGFDDAPVDPGCDSGCEHSDPNEGVLRQQPRGIDEGVAGGRRRDSNGRVLGGTPRNRGVRLEYRQHEPMPHYARSINRRRAVPQQRHPVFEHPDAPSIAERQALNRAPMPDRNRSDSWVARASIGAGEQENTSLPRHARMMTFSPGAAPAEEDWSGMQHIMRSLAQREDIPEEWWAAAGLSRTLSQQGTS
ncbi:hypothetical protein BBAD15_g5009 [Beauveria bassiana D1-5]|uniref:Uncharacterized protein n=1 Tax=Beauveria bassiana D1-5 TaxID=1245745 RepID=A0A0A2VU04_BEABA|nr:hypothetical protein BBAD15_g5009 [Beauveria bassiana D1-5]